MATVLQVGVKVFLKNPEGKILVLERNASKYGKTRGTWDIPGGRINVGEPFLDNLRREVKEETQLSLVSEPILLAAQDIMLPERGIHVVRLTYVAHAEGEPTLDPEESVGYRWVTPDEFLASEDMDVYSLEVAREHFSNIKR